MTHFTAQQEYNEDKTYKFQNWTPINCNVLKLNVLACINFKLKTSSGLTFFFLFFYYFFIIIF